MTDYVDPTPSVFSTLTVGTLSGPVVVPADNLADLRLLSEISSVAQYERLCDGPYLVGHVVDRAALDEPLKYGHMLTPGHQMIVDSITAIDSDLGFAREKPRITMDKSMVAKGRSQRSPLWHKEHGGLVCNAASYDLSKAAAPFTAMGRDYIVASREGTFFLREQMARDRARWPNDILFWNEHPHLFPETFMISEQDSTIGKIAEMEAAARAMGALGQCEPYAIYLLTPKAWHKSPVIPAGGPRTFLRVSYMGLQ